MGSLLEPGPVLTVHQLGSLGKVPKVVTPGVALTPYPGLTVLS